MPNVKPGRIALLSEAERQLVRDAVLRRTEAWIPRASGNFHSFGRAAYIDGPGRTAEYKAAAADTNRELLAEFPWLYERLCTVLSASLGAPVHATRDFALPGFHIFQMKGTDRSREEPALRAHFDLQWRHLFPNSSLEDHFTFTALIEQPSGGASMTVWEMRYQDLLPGSGSTVEYAKAHKPLTIVYRCGELVLHDGLSLHAIGKSTDPAPSGLRITMQGHGFRKDDGSWELYW